MIPKLNLNSGGYLVINPTEALVSIDINSGKSIKQKNVESTALRYKFRSCRGNSKTNKNKRFIWFNYY